MRIPAGRRARHLVAAAAVVAGVLGVAAAPAAAEGPTVTITPSEVSDGQRVTITAAGFPSGLHAFLQCPASFANSGDSLILDKCALLSGIVDGVPDATFEAQVSSTFTVADGSRTVDCNVEPGGCIVGVKLFPSAGGSFEAWAPVVFAGPIDLEPNRNLTDGDMVTASAAGLGAGDWTLAQCTTAFVEAPDPALVDAACGPATPVAVSGGAFTADVAVGDPFVAVDGSSHDCGYTGCAVVLANGGDPRIRSAAISFGPPTISADPATDIGRNAPVAVSVAGIPGDWARLAVCASSFAFADCNPIERIDLDSVGAALAPAVNVPPEGAGPVPAFDCNEEPCSLAVFVNDQDLVASTPVTFAASPVITITPRTGLLEGQEIAISVDNLTPGATYALNRCPYRCEPPIEVTASAEGVATATTTVSQRSGGTYCRAQCHISIWVDGLFVMKTYAMAEGSVAASPATGLGDGDTVHVSGTDLLPTYDGPDLGPFPTGDWALVQCDAALAEAPSLYAAFDRCAPPPNAAAVTVTGSTLDADLPVASSFTSFLGREVDCTTGPAACVVGLYRFDMDAQSSAWLTPISFGTA